MRVSEVRPGMRGYGLTVFRGTTLERFDVEVVGVMPRVNMGEPLVLVRLSGGPITKRGAYLIQGMSGSPIYINGKLLGAFSQGDAWPKEPLGMVTPIESMLEALDPQLPQAPAGTVAALPSFDEPVQAAGVGGAALDGGFFHGPQAVAVQAAARSFRPLALPLSVSGLSPRNLDRLATVLQPYNLAVTQGPGGSAQPFHAELTPGAGVGVVLMSGDVEMSAIGTVTYRDGDNLLAFGHPMLQVGAAQFPISTVWVHDVFPAMPISYKIGSAGELCGTLTQDRPYSVAARVGPTPAMIPITCSVRDAETGRKRVFSMRAANHPLLVGQLLPIAVNQALFQVRPVPGDAVARVRLSLQTEGGDEIQRQNVYYDPAAVDILAVRELQELLGLLSTNSFRRVPVRSLNVDVTIEGGRPTATVDRIFLTQDRFEPGEEVEVGVVLRPYRKEPVLTKTRVRIPGNAANGRAMLMVQGGSTRVNILPPPVPGGAGLNVQPAPPPDATLRQVLRRFTGRERNDELVTRLLFPTSAVNVKGERLSQLPSPIVSVMRSAKATGLRLERDEARAQQQSEYIISGVQTLEITIQRPERLERPEPAQGSLGLGGRGTGSPGAATGRGTLTTGPDLEDLARVQYTVDGSRREFVFTQMPAARVPLTPESEEEEPRSGQAPEKAPPAEGPAAPESEAKGARGGPAPDSRQRGTPRNRTGSGAQGTTPAPAASPAPAAAARESDADTAVLGRQAVQWLQRTQADFERGTMTGMAVSQSGEVRLAPRLARQFESTEQYVWSVLGMGGAIYAGTGDSGQVLKVEGPGKGSVFFRTGELEVHALARDAAGNLYAGTSPNGKVFRIAPDGTGTELFAMNGGPESPSGESGGGKFVLALTCTADGTLYAGTGPQGHIYRLKPGTAPELLCQIPDKSVTALLLAKDGTLYAGTAEEGAVYRVAVGQGSTHPEILYDTDQAAVTGLAQDERGNLYAACAPSGAVYRIEPDGTPRLHYSAAGAPVHALVGDGTGVLYAASANAVLRIAPDGDATFLRDEKKGQFTALAWDDQGRLVAGSVNVGSVYRLESGGTGTFESAVHDARLPARWGRIRYSAVLPEGGTLAVQTRSGNTPEPDASWSGWSDPIVRPGGTFVGSPPARFLQYRIRMEASSGLPALREVSIAYLPRNQAPRLTLATPRGGELWRGSQTLRWSASDPDQDTLTYQVSYSGDGGQTWHPVGETRSVAARVPERAPAPDERAAAAGALQRYRAELDADRSLSSAERDEKYERARGLIEGYLRDNPPAAPAPQTGATPPATTSPPGVTRQASLVWDTRQVPDGVYLIRVVATDAASNPSDALTDSKISEPLVVANTPPQVLLMERDAARAPGPDGTEMLAIPGLAAGRVALRGAQYRVGEGPWTAIEAEDGIWDSPVEQFRLRIPAPTAEVTLEVRVVDGAGNNQTVRVPLRPRRS